MASRIFALLVCLPLLAFALPTAAATAQTLASPEQIERALTIGETPIVVVAQDPLEFRTQLLDFLRDTDDALNVALAHPAIGPRLAEQIVGRGMTIPLPAETYRLIGEADWDTLDQLRQGFAAVPGALAAPALLRESVNRLPAASDLALIDGRASCTTVYNDFAMQRSLIEARRGVTIGSNIVVLIKDVANMAWAIANAVVTVCESPIDIWTSWGQGPLLIIRGVADVINLALAFTQDELGFMAVDADRCVNLTTCPQHGLTERFRPDDTPRLQGRGCDERDNNCTGGIDEIAEDGFAPVVSVDAALTSRCYDSPATAEAAARLAVRAADDCVALSETTQAGAGSLEVMFNRAGCFGTLMATATDINGNMDAANAIVVIDDMAPMITAADLSASCQPDVDAARQAFGFTATDDCSGAQPDVRVVEKECVADFEFEAVDGCGNRSTEMRSVRLDATKPEVDIEQLLLPDVDGRLCFASQSGAVFDIREATTIADNCTARSDLGFTTNAAPTGGNSCDRLVTSTATDTCGFSESASVVARLDAVAPVVSCSVTQPVLWPADSTMHNVGFAMSVSDNCGAQDVIVDLAITSDEPTSLDLSVQGANDPGPDASIVYDGMGNVSSILLRAERQQTQSADGRVYRIRVTGTDGCGNSSFSDCFVSVPKSLSNNRSELVNSGQKFDATVAN